MRTFTLAFGFTFAALSLTAPLALAGETAPGCAQKVAAVTGTADASATVTRTANLFRYDYPAIGNGQYAEAPGLATPNGVAVANASDATSCEVSFESSSLQTN